MSKKFKRKTILLLCACFVISAWVSLLPMLAVPAWADTQFVEVTATHHVTPSFQWCQHFDGSWSTYSSFLGEWFEAEDAGGQPAARNVTTQAEIAPPERDWVHRVGEEVVGVYRLTDLIEPPIPIDVKEHDDMDPNLNANPEIKEGMVIITGTTGPDVKTGRPDSNICGHRPGYIYPFPVTVTWQGKVKPDEFLGLEIDPEHKTLSVGDTRQFTVTAVWNQRGEVKRYPVENYRLSWSSSQPARASVNSSGVVRGLQETSTDAIITATFSERNASVSARVNVLRSETPVYIITGDFDILPADTIEYRDSFTLKPKDFQIPSACTYEYHEYKIERDGRSWVGGRTTGQATSTSYSYSNYPSVIAVGSHNVSIRIVANCPSGTVDSGWISDKTLTVNGPTDNSPPVFQIGWTTPGQWRADAVQSKVVVGTRLDLVLLDDPPPSDPDGVMFMGFDFSSSGSWMQQLPNKHTQYTNGFHNVLMDTAGMFCATGIAQDTFGLQATHRTCVEVVPPNPVPVITIPDRIVEGRPVDPPIHGDNSYSPYPGRIIDHDRSIWTNRRTLYPAPGPQTVTLEVFDNTGLKSLAPATRAFEVQPDLPPIPLLEFPPAGLRDTTITINNKSYSPDGDQIVRNDVKVWYDSNNDGNSAGETIHNLAMDENNRLTFNPDKVGKYHFIVDLEEDWGRTATGEFILDVVNEKPVATFSVSSEVPVPTLPDYTDISVDELLSASWTTTTFDGEWGKKPWYKTDDGYMAINRYDATHGHNQSPHNSLDPNGSIKHRSVTLDDRAEYHLKDEYTFEQQKLDNGSTMNTFKTWDGSRSVSRNSFRQTLITQNTISHSTSYACDGYTTTNRDYWTFERYFNLDDRGTSDGYCSRTGGTFANASLLTHSLHQTSAIGYEYVYDNAGRYITDVAKYVGNHRTLNPIKVWNYPIPEDNISIRGFSRNFAENKDGTRVAFFMVDRSSTYLVILDATTGNELLIKEVGDSRRDANGYNNTTFQIMFSYEDKMLVQGPGGFFYYDFHGNLISTISHYEFRDWYGPGVHYEITRDGYLVMANGPSNGSSGITRRYIYIQIFDLKSDTLDLLVKHELGWHQTYEVKFDSFSMVGDNKAYLRYVTRSSDGNRSFTELIVYTDTPSPRKALEPGYTYGQFENNQLNIQDGEFLYTLNALHNETVLRDKNTHAGLSFRMKDDKNFYRVESDMYHTRLVKIVNGNKTILSEVRYDRDYQTDYNFKVTAYDNTIRVFINGALQISVNDSTFTQAGTFGIYAKTTNAAFKDFKYYDARSASGGQTIHNAMIIGGELDYEVLFSDPENDPRVGQLDRWTYRHENPNKFLNAGDGKSGTSIHHNKTYQGEPQRTLEKVGVYRIELQSTDDPHPDYRYPDHAFGEYRERSLAYSQYVVVHRAPVAQFSLSINTANNNVIWHDTSYDPDRWLSPTQYSTEATGIDYHATRGIVERKYYYVTPSGQTVQQKLVTPQETGVYLVGMAVKDEYGAWSEWAEQSITVGAIATPNEPPTAGFAVTPTAGHRGTLFRITSTASDREDGPAANLEHAYYIRNVTEGGVETLQSMSRGTWTKTFSSLGMMEIRQVVTDSKGATAQFTRTVTVTNRAPVAQFTWSPQPVWEGDLVTFHNQSTDPDGDPLTYSWQIRNATSQLLYTAADDEITYRFQVPGIHHVSLHVSDGMAAHQTTHTIQVLPLTLEADVAHTPEWLAYHEERGHRTTESPKQFYSGEWMVLTARHATAPVDWLTARLTATDFDGNPLTVETALSAAAEPDRSEGVLYDERFSSLSEGLAKGVYDITFRIRYANGVEKTVTVPIEIIGHVLGTVQVHRLR